MNYFKLMLAVAGGVLVAVLVVFAGCYMQSRGESEDRFLRMAEESRALYKEQTGRDLPPAEEMVRQFKRETGR